MALNRIDSVKAMDWLARASRGYEVSIEFDQNADEYVVWAYAKSYRGRSLADAFERAMNENGGFIG